MNLAKLQDTKSIHRNHLHFYILNNEISKREIKESIPFTIAAKIIKYLRINLPKETKELYTENYKTLMKEIKDDMNRWRNSPCSWVGGIIIVKMTMLPNAIYRLNAIPMKIPMAFPHRTRIFFTIHMKKQKTPNSQRSLEKEAWSWRNQPS